MPRRSFWGRAASIASATGGETPLSYFPGGWRWGGVPVVPAGGGLDFGEVVAVAALFIPQPNVFVQLKRCGPWSLGWCAVWRSELVLSVVG